MRESEFEGRMSVQQKMCLLDYMEDHPDLAHGKFMGAEGKKTLAGIWEVLSSLLNSLEGPRKSAAKWKRAWIDLKNKTKRKAAEVKTLRLKTGGGPIPILLSGLDQRVIDIISDKAVYSIQSTDDVVLESDEPFLQRLSPTSSATSTSKSVSSTSNYQLATSTSLLSMSKSGPLASRLDSTCKPEQMPIPVPLAQVFVQMPAVSLSPLSMSEPIPDHDINPIQIKTEWDDNSSVKMGVDEDSSNNSSERSTPESNSETTPRKRKSGVEYIMKSEKVDSIVDVIRENNTILKEMLTERKETNKLFKELIEIMRNK